MKKIISVVGARPQFIKAAMISRALRKSSAYKEILLHTGQHYDDNMSDIFFRDLKMPKPDFILRTRSKKQGKQTALMLAKIEKILIKERPNWLLVYGDTNTTLAGALAAAKLHIPIAHIEAGLRSFNTKMPEEINRKITDHLSTLLFCPTQTAMQNAMQEGISNDKLFLVGDVMYDAALYMQRYNKKNTILAKLNLEKKSYILVTIHRMENTDDRLRLKKLMLSLKKIASNYTLVFPIHPRTRLAVKKNNILSSIASVVKLIEPVGYLDMSALQKSARLIITDSGGIQKEAYFYQTPCIIVRDQTEWPELLSTGGSILCSNQDFTALPSLVDKFIAKRGNYLELYGNGNAAAKVVKYLYNFS